MTDDTFTDVFDTPVRKNTQVELEVAAHYPYNPERWRVFVDGTRQLIQYADIPEYNFPGHNHELRPAAGETVTLETTERPRYTVQHELSASFSFALNQDLQSGDAVRIGLWDGSDGWYLEQTGAHDPDEADLVIENQGTEQLRRENVDIHVPTTQFARLAIRTAWYDVTRNKWERSYAHSDEGGQVNPEIAKTALPKKNGPEVGNLPLRFDVEAGASTTDLQLNAGSCALVTYGKASDRVRQKVAAQTVTVANATFGTYEPVLALRVDPDRKITNTQLLEATAVEFDAAADIILLPIAVDPRNTDANFDDPDADGTNEGPSAPPEQSDTNSVLQYTTDVTTFPDSTGAVGTTATDPGGYQIGYGALYSSGRASSAETYNSRPSVKRSISDRDIIVVLANAGGTGDVSLEYIAEQDW